MIRRLSIAFTIVLPIVLSVVLLNVGVAGARHHHHPPPTTTPTTVPLQVPAPRQVPAYTRPLRQRQPPPPPTGLLPGETTWSSGAPSYEFGTNDTIDYNSPNVDTLPSVQSYEKQAGLTLNRVWAYDSDSNLRTSRRKVDASNNAGMTCMFMLGETDDLTWLESTVQLTEPMGCHIFEFGNEPDNGGSLQGTIAKYTSQWIADVPALRSLSVCETNGVPDPNVCSFGGPALTWSASTNTNASSYPDDMSYFLGTAKAAGVLPDFVTYHDYPCQKATTKAQCISMTPGDSQWNYNTVITDEKNTLGHTIPTGVTEYNFDGGDGILYSWSARRHLHVPVDSGRSRCHRVAPHALCQRVHLAELLGQGTWTCFASAKVLTRIPPVRPQALRRASSTGWWRRWRSMAARPPSPSPTRCPNSFVRSCGLETKPFSHRLGSETRIMRIMGRIPAALQLGSPLGRARRPRGLTSMRLRQ